MVHVTLTLNREDQLLFLELNRNRNELVLIVVVARVAGHHDARIANLHLRPCILGESVDIKQTMAPVRGENRKEV